MEEIHRLDAVKGRNSGIAMETEAVVAGDEEPSFPPLKSEDSGIGLLPTHGHADTFQQPFL